MYIPPRLLPLYVFLVGRRQCCGARWAATHLDCCPRHPWSHRPAPDTPNVPSPAIR